MPDITQLTFIGDWRIRVGSRDSDWPQRVSLNGTAAGNLVLVGNPGQSIDVYGNGQAPWTLTIEHDDGHSGWQPNWLRGTSAVAGTNYQWQVASEDNTTTSSDRDFNDLIVILEKIGMAAQPVAPFAILPSMLQMMPEGIFEAAFGQYFMAVTVQNIWTIPWPASSRAGLSARCRAWLAAAGVNVIDAWSTIDQAALGQTVNGGAVVVGSLAPWQSRRIYFKVDVSQAVVRKHWVELQVLTDQGAEDPERINRAARAPIYVSRTTYHPATSQFVSRCDVGTLTASIKRVVIDFASFKRAVAWARKSIGVAGSGGGSGTVSGVGGTPACCSCGPAALERIRGQLRAFLEGKEIDLCAIWRLLICCCGGHGNGTGSGGGDGTWTGLVGRVPSFFIWPTEVDYTVTYNTAFEGQYGPIPFADPWWKLLLLLLAIILTIADAISGGADIKAHSDDFVIGTLTRSLINALRTQPTTNPAATDPGSVDAAVVTLNGNRGLTPAIFTVLDAASGEASTTPINSLGAHIDLPGMILTNDQINALFQNVADHPGDPMALDALRAFKSGARSGTTQARLATGIVPIQKRGPEDDGSYIFFLNQLTLTPDPSTSGASCAGDSGSLWIQQGSNAILGLNHAGPEDGSDAIACRIEDVTQAMGIRFA